MNEQVWEKVVVLQGSAGQAILLGQLHEQKWYFKKEEDPLLRSENPLILNNFRDALLLLGHSWSYLTPIYVHPLLKQQLWYEVKQRHNLSQLASWRMACM